MNARYFDMFEHQYSTISPEEVHDDRVKRVLVDLDNTVVNWDREFIKRFSMRNVMSPDEVQKIVENRICLDENACKTVKCIKCTHQWEEAVNKVPSENKC